MSGSEPAPDLRGPVLAGGAWLGSWLCTAGDVGLAAACLAAGVAVALAGASLRRPLAVAVGGVLLCCLVTGGLRSVAMHTGPVAELAGQAAVATLEGRLLPGRLVDGGIGGPSWYGLLEPGTVSARGQRWQAGQPVLVTAGGSLARGWAAVVPGTRVRAVVRLAPPEPSDAFGAVARAREPPEVVGSADAAATAVHRVREGLRQAVAGLAPEPRALVPALVVGDTSAMDEDLQERFRVTGLAHLAAVSGANLTLLLASLLWLAVRLGARGWWLRAVAVGGVLAFVALCHGEPSVLRAAAMGAVGLAALGLGGRRRGLRQLSWAVVGLLVVDPWLSSSAGFALSVAASAGIICWARIWTDQLAGWLPRGLGEAIAIPVAAQLATQPIVVALSGQLSVVGVLANLVAGPLVGPTTVLGFLCAAVSPVWPGLAAGLGWLAGWGAQALCWIASLGASLPAAAIGWPTTTAGLAVLVGVSAAGFLLLGRVFRTPAAVLAVAAGMVALLLRPATTPGWPPPDWAVVQCDVGQGSATVVRTAPGEAILVDTGPDPPALERCLAGLGVERVPLLVVTHFHADHVDGLPALADRQVATVVLPRGHQGPGRERVVSDTAGARLVEAAPGLVVAVAETRVEVASALPSTAAPVGVEAESSWENDGSVVTRIDTGSVVVPATGDIERDGQAALLRSGADLRADVLIVPHHGSATQSAELFGAVAAPIALIGVGEDNDYGHPAPSALQLLREAGSTLYRTDTDGSVAITRTGTGWTVTTQRVP
ncbi:MAG: ComEC/Rec2 family competence protein [Propionicimonas sp.]